MKAEDASGIALDRKILQKGSFQYGHLFWPFIQSFWSFQHPNTQPYLYDKINTNIDKTNIPKLRIICFNYVNHPGSSMANKRLTHIRSAWVEFLQKLGLIQVVCSWDRINVLNCTSNWSMPMVIWQSTQESLKHCPLHK